MQAVVVLLVLALSVIPVAKASGADRVVAGPALVHDGDTIAIAGVRIRVYGIDAAEGEQRYAEVAHVSAVCGSKGLK